jgi:sec-independent protein translocase protein TatC
MGLIDDRMMTGFFRYAIVIIFILSAILTPPDVISQILMAMPLTFLYGVSILIVRAVNPAPKEELATVEDEEDTID